MMSKHTDWVRTTECAVCGDHTSVELAHLRYSQYRSGKANPGIGQKPADLWTLGLCSYHHAMQHKMGERHFWQSHGIDPIIYCTLLHQYSGDINMLPYIKTKAGTQKPGQ